MGTGGGRGVGTGGEGVGTSEDTPTALSVKGLSLVTGIVRSSDQVPALTLCLTALRSRGKPGLPQLSKGCPESQS